MPNLFTKLIIEPGTRVKLGDIFPGYRRSRLHEAASPEIPPRVRRIDPVHLGASQEIPCRTGTRVKLAEIDPGYCGKHGVIEAASGKPSV
jgi:hypothetical protein